MRAGLLAAVLLAVTAAVTATAGDLVWRWGDAVPWEAQWMRLTIGDKSIDVMSWTTDQAGLAHAEIAFSLQACSFFTGCGEVSGEGTIICGISP